MELIGHKLQLISCITAAQVRKEYSHLQTIETKTRSTESGFVRVVGYDDIDTNEIPFSLDQIANASSSQLKAMIEVRVPLFFRPTAQ